MNRQLIYSWYEQYKNGIFRFALSILKDPHLAEDVLQETYLRLLSGKYAVEPEKAQAWLYRVARNLCYDLLRRRKREEAEPEQPFHWDGDYGYLELIAPLSRKEQEIVTLKIVGRLTHREIGGIMGMTEQAVKKRYERAIRQLREQEGI